MEDDTEQYEPVRVVSPWTSPPRGAWGWAPGHPYAYPEVPPGPGRTALYLVVAAWIVVALLMTLALLGFLR